MGVQVPWFLWQKVLHACQIVGLDFVQSRLLAGVRVHFLEMLQQQVLHACQLVGLYYLQLKQLAAVGVQVVTAVLKLVLPGWH